MEDTNTQQVTDAEVIEPAVEREAQPVNRMKIAIIILALGVVTSGALYYVLHERNNTVAVVNGYKISKTEYANSVAMITQNATMQGVDVTDPAIQSEINNQAVSILVNNALLIGGAKAAGIALDEAKVQSEYDALVSELGGEETLKTRMAEVGLTEEKLRSNISERIIADAFIEAETDIESIAVTDAEVEEFLASIQTEGAELPPLEEIRPQIESQILGQKRQAVVDEFLAKLRETAEIDIKIEGITSVTE